MSSFAVGTFNLSLENSQTGNYLKANYYTVPGIVVTNADGVTVPRQLSIGQLVMAICLELAVADEASIVTKMESMAKTITKLEVLTGIQEKIINNPDSNGNLRYDQQSYDISAWPEPYSNKTSKLSATELLTFLMTPKEGDTSTPTNYGPGCKGLSKSSSSEEVVSAVSSALDDYNTVNQEEMIDLQSLTNKRDQRYDLITNMLKSFNNVMASIANNM